MKNIIETFNLTKVHNGKIRAVDDLNIAIREGEIFGLLGPNGALAMIVTKPNSDTGLR